MDIKIVETGNGGDLQKNLRDLALTEGFENMPYLAMFGGNPEQSTPPNRPARVQAFDWWGNSLLFQEDPSRQFNSITEKTLNSVALTSSGRISIEEAIKQDLAFMQDFAEVAVEVSIIETDKVLIEINITEPSTTRNKLFVYIWDATASGLEDKLIPSVQLEDIGIFDHTFDHTFA